MRGGLAGLHRAAVSLSCAFRRLGWALIRGSGSCTTQVGVWPSRVFLPAGCALDFLFSPKAADRGSSQTGWPCTPVVSPALSLTCLVTEALPPWLALRLCSLPPGPDEPWDSAHSWSLAPRPQGEMKCFCCLPAALPLGAIVGGGCGLRARFSRFPAQGAPVWSCSTCCGLGPASELGLSLAVLTPPLTASNLRNKGTVFVWLEFSIKCE